jgi:hypothetical protein
VRHRDVKSGDLDSLFSPTVFDRIFQRNSRKESDSETYRLGLNVSPSKRSTLLGSFIYVDEDGTIRLLPGDPATFITSKGHLAEMQYLFREETFNAILGGGFYRLNQTFETDNSRIREKTEHANAYIYARQQFPSSVTWTLGLSGDIFDSDPFTKKRTPVNPKVGMLWNFVGESVFRAAWFRAFKRSTLFNQTIEPTQVAGFNQFFDDFTETKSERWGVGIDHRFSSFLTGGVEVSQRHLKVPPVEDRWKESLYRAYLQLTPHSRWAVEIEYSREKFDNSESAGPLDTDTQTIPFSVSYFSPSGFFAKLRASYLKQKVALDSGSDSDSATFLDLNLGYRLPRRLGILEVQFQNMLNQNYRYEGLHGRKPRERTGLPSPLPFPPGFGVSVRFNLSF